MLLEAESLEVLEDLRSHLRVRLAETERRLGNLLGILMAVLLVGLVLLIYLGVSLEGEGYRYLAWILVAPFLVGLWIAWKSIRQVVDSLVTIELVRGTLIALWNGEEASPRRFLIVFEGALRTLASACPLPPELAARLVAVKLEIQHLVGA